MKFHMKWNTIYKLHIKFLIRLSSENLHQISLPTHKALFQRDARPIVSYVWRVLGSTTRVTRVSSDNVNIAAEHQHQEPAEVLSQLDNTSALQISGSKSVASVAAPGVLVAASGVVCDSFLFSLEIAVSKKLLTSDGAHEDQCIPDKPGCSYRTTTRGVRLARQSCWCCACRSSSYVSHESYCPISSWKRG